MEKIIGSCCAATALLALVSSCTEEQKRPNIICIVCEDISPMVGCFGDKVAVTPNLDEFSKSAIRFTNVHSNIGVSSPSRYALITGRYPMADGANYMRTLGSPDQKPEGVQPYSVIVNPDVKCYTEYLRKAGYYCTNNAKTDYQFTIPATAWDECGTDAHWKNRPEGMPFFSIFNIEVTHESRVWRRTNEKLSVNPSDIVVPPYYPDNDIVRHDMAVAYSNITEMDKMFKKLVDELKETNVYDNTIIIWYSDNGGPLPHHKREIYDRGTNVPFMISFPDGYKAGSVSDRLVGFVDIPATILSLAEIKAPDYMHGVPFLGKYASKEERQYVYGGRDRLDECIDKQGYIRDKRYRYVRNYYPGTPVYLDVKFRLSMPMMNNILELNKESRLDSIQASFFDNKRLEEELYDLEKDPYELNSIVNDKSYSSVLERLRKDYDSWIETYVPDWFIPEKDNIKRILPDGKQPFAAAPEFSMEDGLVTICSQTEGASINYRIVEENGNKGRWMIYSSPVQLKNNENIEAVSARIGYKNSKVVAFK